MKILHKNIATVQLYPDAIGVTPRGKRRRLFSRDTYGLQADDVHLVQTGYTNGKGMTVLHMKRGVNCREDEEKGILTCSRKMQ